MVAASAPPPQGAGPELPFEQDVSFLDQKQARIILATEFDKAEHLGTELSTVLIDLNQLKAVNDDIGHEQGNEYLALGQNNILSVLEEFKIENYVPARIGGDEFLLILPGVGSKTVRELAERLRSKTKEDLSTPLGDIYRDHHVAAGLAVGTSTKRPGMLSDSEMMTESDGEMYRDKLSQFPELTEEQIEFVRLSLAYLKKANIRPRDLARAIEHLGQRGIEHAMSTEDPEDSESILKLFE